jgi:hypothetical protein
MKVWLWVVPYIAMHAPTLRNCPFVTNMRIVHNDWWRTSQSFSLKVKLLRFLQENRPSSILSEQRGRFSAIGQLITIVVRSSKIRATEEKCVITLDVLRGDLALDTSVEIYDIWETWMQLGFYLFVFVFVHLILEPRPPLLKQQIQNCCEQSQQQGPQKDSMFYFGNLCVVARL